MAVQTRLQLVCAGLHDGAHLCGRVEASLELSLLLLLALETTLMEQRADTLQARHDRHHFQHVADIAPYYGASAFIYGVKGRERAEEQRVGLCDLAERIRPAPRADDSLVAVPPIDCQSASRSDVR